jgi:hypothetical protein
MALDNAVFGEVYKESWGRLLIGCPEDWLGFVGVMRVSTQETSSFLLLENKVQSFDFVFCAIRHFLGASWTQKNKFIYYKFKSK